MLNCIKFALKHFVCCKVNRVKSSCYMAMNPVSARKRCRPCGYVPYGWQFKDEQVYIDVAKGRRLNWFGMISRPNRLHYSTTSGWIRAAFVVDTLETLSWQLSKPRVVVLDNARIHTGPKVRQRLCDWQQRGLYSFYLPAYSPHLNVSERV